MAHLLVAPACKLCYRAALPTPGFYAKEKMPLQDSSSHGAKTMFLAVAAAGTSSGSYLAAGLQAVVRTRLAH